jgi:DNA mismatch endonuclease (patch repair protein)
MTLRPGDAEWPLPTSEAISAVMRANRWRDTSPEVAVRSALHRRGLRFRKRHTIPLDGRRWTQPDAVFTRARVALFVDGCFWHSCPVHGTAPAANSSYWARKLTRNVARDRDTTSQLEARGWKVVRAWEHEDPEAVAERVQSVVRQRLGGSSL